MILFLVAVASGVPDAGQTMLKRARGDGLLWTEGANTPGSGNIWASSCLTGYIWDATRGDVEARPLVQGHLDTRIEAGIFNIIGAVLRVQAPAALYGSKVQCGALGGGLKATTPNNADLRFFGAGIELLYLYSMLDKFISLGGYRKNGAGFSPDGIKTPGSTCQARLLWDVDFLAKTSRLPLKIMGNAGFRIPLSSENRFLAQYLASAGIVFVGLNLEAFIEYSLEAFFNNSPAPKRFSPPWFEPRKVWEVAFAENPMYLTFGGRYRYASGVCIAAYAPLCISANRGSTMSFSGGELLRHYPEEARRGVTDGFDPWYAKWKVILEFSFPLRYKQTGAEMRRNFLLLKNRRGGARIDMEEKMRRLKEPTEEQKRQQDAEDRQKRLEEIEKRRREIQQSK